MAEYQIKLDQIKIKSWHFIIGIVVLSLFIGYRFSGLDKVIDEKALRAIEHQIELDYTRTSLPSPKGVIESGDRDDMEEEIENILSRSIDIRSVSASRSLFSVKSYPDAVFRVKYSVLRESETEDEGIRYMHFQNGMISGWRYHRDVDKMGYYRNFI